MSNIKTLAEKYFDEIVNIRRDIHRHPEIGGTETRTAGIIRDKLKEFGVDKIETPAPTATVALINGNKGEGRCVALRCDIDALPVTEQTGLPFSSENEGVMHACGHDMHASMLLGVAKILCNMRDEFAGTVKLIFQHSEDTLPGGAKELVEAGVMAAPKVDAILGMHMMPHEKMVGNLGYIVGPATTSVDLYTVKVSGRGGHGSAPHTTDDPLLTACQMVVMLQQVVARRVNPLDTAILSVSTINSGVAVNVIPDSAEFTCIARAYTDEARRVMKEQVFTIAKGMEFTSGCKVNIDHYEGYPSVSNDEGVVEVFKSAVAKNIGEDMLYEMPEPMSFSEDFSYYTKHERTPGAFFLCYAGYEGKLVSLHNPTIILREDAMVNGMTAMASSAIEFLKK